MFYGHGEMGTRTGWSWRSENVCILVRFKRVQVNRCSVLKEDGKRTNL